MESGNMAPVRIWNPLMKWIPSVWIHTGLNESILFIPHIQEKNAQAGGEWEMHLWEHCYTEGDKLGYKVQLYIVNCAALQRDIAWANS